MPATTNSIPAACSGCAVCARHASTTEGVFYAPAYDVYGVGFYRPGEDHGDGGLGNAWLYYDGRTGAPAGALTPGQGSAGDIFLQAQFPLHSGRILGLPGRILVSALGLCVAALSATGLVIWARKRAARVSPNRSSRRRPGPRWKSADVGSQDAEPVQRASEP